MDDFDDAGMNDHGDVRPEEDIAVPAHGDRQEASGADQTEAEAASVSTGAQASGDAEEQIGEAATAANGQQPEEITSPMPTVDLDVEQSPAGQEQVSAVPPSVTGAPEEAALPPADPSADAAASSSAAVAATETTNAGATVTAADASYSPRANFLKRKSRLLPDRNGDPMESMGNIFDVAVLIGVGMLIMALSSFGLKDAISQKNVTIVTNPGTKDMKYIVRTADGKIRQLTPSEQQASGQGSAVGTVYQLKDGTFVWSANGNAPGQQ